MTPDGVSVSLAPAGSGFTTAASIWVTAGVWGPAAARPDRALDPETVKEVLGASESGICGLLGITRIGRSVPAINPAAAQPRTMGRQM